VMDFLGLLTPERIRAIGKEVFAASGSELMVMEMPLLLRVREEQARETLKAVVTEGQRYVEALDDWQEVADLIGATMVLSHWWDQLREAAEGANIGSPEAEEVQG